MAKKKQSKQLKITQVRSGIGRKATHRRTLEALGLKRHQQSVVHDASPAILGMIDKVSFLVRVDELES